MSVIAGAGCCTSQLYRASVFRRFAGPGLSTWRIRRRCWNGGLKSHRQGSFGTCAWPGQGLPMSHAQIRAVRTMNRPQMLHDGGAGARTPAATAGLVRRGGLVALALAVVLLA